MKERPILFSAPMIRALLAGTKTQTRRVVDIAKMCRPYRGETHDSRGAWRSTDNGLWQSSAGNWNVWSEPRPCPFGVPGERLWVREAWRFVDFEMLGGSNWNAAVEYRCDGERGPRSSDVNENTRCGWRPSIHMPRWASRLTLEVTGVRVERLQSISEDDAQAEGARYFPDVPELRPHPYKLSPPRWSMFSPTSTDECMHTAKMAFANAWDTINGKRDPWDSNPWVWVVSFRRVQP